MLKYLDLNNDQKVSRAEFVKMGELMVNALKKK